jgi:hypothetical protein
MPNNEGDAAIVDNVDEIPSADDSSQDNRSDVNDDHLQMEKSAHSGPKPATNVSIKQNASDQSILSNNEKTILESQRSKTSLSTETNDHRAHEPKINSEKNDRQVFMTTAADDGSDFFD